MSSIQNISLENDMDHKLQSAQSDLNQIIDGIYLQMELYIKDKEESMRKQFQEKPLESVEAQTKKGQSTRSTLTTLLTISTTSLSKASTLTTSLLTQNLESNVTSNSTSATDATSDTTKSECKPFIIVFLFILNKYLI